MNMAGQSTSQNRACDPCRHLKTRCTPPTDRNTSSCSRCVRLNLSCTYSSRVRKKQRERTDARVANLEKELLNLRSAISIGKGSLEQPVATAERALVSEAGDLSEASSPTPSWPVSAQTSLADSLETAGPMSLDQLPQQDVSRLLHVYMNDFAPLYPVVQLDLSQRLDTDGFKHSNPLLFQAILGAASIKERPNFARHIQSVMVDRYAQTIFSDHSNVLDLVQAVLVTVMWYLPPSTDFSQKRKFYELAHLAISSALEAGLDLSTPGSPENEEEIPRSANLPRARAFVGCYMLSQGMSMTLRRPSMLRASTALSSCIDLIRVSAESSALDKVFFTHATLYQVIEDISSSLDYSNPQRPLDLSDAHVSGQVHRLRRRLLDWKDHAALSSQHDGVALTYHYAMVYLHEVSLYPEHDPQDFIAPFPLDRVGVTGSCLSILMNAHHTCLSNLLDSAHSFLDAFISLSPDVLRAVPVNFYFRLVYVAFILTKLAASHQNPSSQVGKVMDAKHTKAEYYRGLIIQKLNNVSANGSHSGSKIFLEHLNNLGQNWDSHARIAPQDISLKSSAAQASQPPPHSENAGHPPIQAQEPMQQQPNDLEYLMTHTPWQMESIASFMSPNGQDLGPEFDLWTGDINHWTHTGVTDGDIENL